MGVWNGSVPLLNRSQEYSYISIDYWQTLQPSELLCGQNFTHLHDVSRPQAMNLTVHCPLSWEDLQQTVCEACYLVTSQGLVPISWESFSCNTCSPSSYSMVSMVRREEYWAYIPLLIHTSTSAQTLNVDGQTIRNFAFLKKPKSHIYCSARPSNFHAPTRMS